MPSRYADPNALRRDRKDDAAFTTLSPAGRSEPAPPWPLVGGSDREAELWSEMWAKPQALLWDTQDFEVALLVRRIAEAEQPGSPVSLGTLVRQMMGSLLLTIPAMRAARVRIGDPVSAPVRAISSSSRDRLRPASERMRDRAQRLEEERGTK